MPFSCFRIFSESLPLDLGDLRKDAANIKLAIETSVGM
jgi:hypothetical protein